jgi:hypothetical protein
MAGNTEAACLLETGAMYGKRLLLRPAEGDPVFAGFRPGVFSLYFGDAPIYHFDREGRWQRAFVAGTHYLKGLDATVQAIDRIREGENLVLKRRTLGYAEAGDLDARIRDTAIALLSDVNGERLERLGPPTSAATLAVDELRDALEQVMRWDAAAWFAQRERFVETYGPLPLLPPDALGAVVLQGTLGHANGIAFGAGQAADHAVRSPREFAAHAAAVRRLLGHRLAQSRSVFLAGSDVLRQPPELVAAYLAAIASTFPMTEASTPRRSRESYKTETEGRLDGVAAFLDDFTGTMPDAAAWRQFGDLHLRRVSLGIESGAPEVRSHYRRSWDNSELRSVVAALKEAGLAVGILVLVDAGGIEYADRHLMATAELINALPLGPGDLVSLLDANEIRDPALDAAQLGFTPLTGPRWGEQQAELKRRLAAVRTERKAKIAPYSLEKQGA